MKNWNLVEIGNSGLKIADGNYSAKYPNSREFMPDGVPFIRANNFKNKTIIDDELYFISPKKHSELKKGHLLPDDVLITTRGNIGQVALTPERHKSSNINAQIVLLRCNEFWIPKYLLYVLTIDFVTEQFSKLTTGTALKQLPVKNLKKIKLPLPPLPQQQKIANILDAADALRQNDKALIAKYDELTQALFLDMFGDPVSNPKGFELSTVGTQCNVKGGKRVPKEEKLVSENTGFPYIKAGNIKAGKVTLKNLEYLLPQTREKIKRYSVESGDVCITVVGANIGDIGIVPQELHLANLTENANKILIKNKSLLNSTYLAKYLQMDFVQKNISAKTMAVGVPKLALFRIEQIELLIPPIFLQNQYQERITLIEEQRAIAQASAVKSEELFNSLLQKAFKGELI